MPKGRQKRTGIVGLGREKKYKYSYTNLNNLNTKGLVQ